ncbi:hypothetical protein NUSPORA_02037 [Nucleospora cyclopteri]
MKKLLILNWIFSADNQQSAVFNNFYDTLKESEAVCNINGDDLEIDVPYFYRITSYHALYKDNTIKKEKLGLELKSDDEIKQNLEGIYKFMKEKTCVDKRRMPEIGALQTYIQNKVENEKDEKLKTIFIRISKMNIHEFAENWRNILMNHFAKEYSFKVSMNLLMKTIDKSALQIILLLHHGKSKAYKSEIILINKPVQIPIDIPKSKPNYKLMIIIGLVLFFIVICILICFIIRINYTSKPQIVYTVR